MEHRLWKVHLTGPDTEETQQTILEHLDDFDMGYEGVPLDRYEYIENTIGIRSPRVTWRVEPDRKYLLRKLNKMLREHGDPGRAVDAECMTGAYYFEGSSHIVTPLSKRPRRLHPRGWGSSRGHGRRSRPEVRRRLYTGD